MIVPERLRTIWTELEFPLRLLHTSVRDSLAILFEASNFPLSGRIKAIESVAEKIESGRYNNLSAIEDFVAFTVIVPSQPQVAKVLDHCQQAFHVESVRQRSDYTKPPEAFWFDCMRIKCKIRPVTGEENPAATIASNYYFEVQVRTAFEHAWSTATHDLAYKTSKVDWGRLRLSWQLKATVELLGASIGAFDSLSAHVPAAMWPDLDAKRSFSTCLDKLFDGEFIPRELYPKDMSRVCDNVVDLILSVRPRVSPEVCFRAFDTLIRSGQLGLVPRSISIYQLFLASLCQSDIEIARLTRPCHVTDELVTLFPSTRRLAPVFGYS
jgi:ppGpp synthetase/RelA/SpoT-type nucleotidyltranferase